MIYPKKSSLFSDTLIELFKLLNRWQESCNYHGIFSFSSFYPHVPFKKLASHSFRIHEKNGVTIAETTGGPKYEGELFTYEIILTLDQNEEIEESLLYRPIRFIMDEGGKYYVQDSGNNRIAIFDLDGEFSHSIGRQGQGPGEFQSVSLLSARDGYVTILDNRLQRTSVFDYNGRFIKHITFSKASLNTVHLTLT